MLFTSQETGWYSLNSLLLRVTSIEHRGRCCLVLCVIYPDEIKWMRHEEFLEVCLIIHRYKIV